MGAENFKLGLWFLRYVSRQTDIHVEMLSAVLHTHTCCSKNKFYDELPFSCAVLSCYL